MAGHFTHLLQKNGVTRVTGVTTGNKSSIIKPLPVTLPLGDSIIPSVTGVTDTGYTISSVKEPCNQQSVTVNASIPAASSLKITPVTPLHQNAAYYLKHYQHRLTKEAETFAFQETVLLWIHENPPLIAEGMCAGCGKPITGSQEFIAYGGIQTHWHGGDLSKGIYCSKQYIESRKKEAEEALSAIEHHS